MTQSELHLDRILYTKLLAQLLTWIFSQGYEVMIGQDGLKHMDGSLHYVGLADDLLFFKNDVYLTNTEDYKFAGDYWKGLDVKCRWGGNFQGNPDGNHFSLTYGGKS